MCIYYLFWNNLLIHLINISWLNDLISLGFTDYMHNSFQTKCKWSLTIISLCYFLRCTKLPEQYWVLMILQIVRVIFFIFFCEHIYEMNALIHIFLSSKTIPYYFIRQNNIILTLSQFSLDLQRTKHFILLFQICYKFTLSLQGLCWTSISDFCWDTRGLGTI